MRAFPNPHQACLSRRDIPQIGPEYAHCVRVLHHKYLSHLLDKDSSEGDARYL